MKTKYLIACTLGLLLATACSNEVTIGQGENSLFGEVPEGMFEYRFTMKGVTPTRLSYAEVAMEEAELKIHNGKVLVFAQTAAGTLADADKLVCVKDAKIANNKSSFLVNGSTNFYGAAKVAVLLISNWETSNIASLTLTDGTTTYKDVVDQLQSKGDAGAEIATRGLLQIGKAIDNDVPSAGQRLAVGDITIKRPFARFDIKNAGQKALSITGLKVKNISNKFYVLSETFPADAIFTHQKEVAVPAGLNRPADGSKPDADPKFIPGVLYSYPGSVDGEDSPVLLVTGKLVTGAGKEQELTDYEVPFAKNGNKLRIKTNTRYTLTLKAELDGIVVDITESFAEWGSVEDASLTYESDLNNYANLARVGEGLKLTGIKQDGTFQFEGKSRENYNFSIERLPEGVTVTATVGGEAQAVEKVESYGELTHYNVLLADKVQAVLDKSQLIDIKGVSAEGEMLFHMEINYLRGIVRYPMPDGSFLPAVYVDEPQSRRNYWVAPVNVGAMGIHDPGKLFQLYRNNGGWDNVDAVLAKVSYDYIYAGEESKLTDEYFYAGRDKNESKYGNWSRPQHNSSIFLNARDKWMAVSDGTNNPCPVGWKPLSSVVELYDPLRGQRVIASLAFTGSYILIDGNELCFPYAEDGYLDYSEGRLNRFSYGASYLNSAGFTFMVPYYGSYPPKYSGSLIPGFLRCVYEEESNITPP